VLIGLQLTHSGRYSRPNAKDRAEAMILYRHPILDRRLALPPDYPVITDDEIRRIIDAFHRAAPRNGLPSMPTTRTRRQASSFA
jgi:2,4-dienoyl-CoA reductase-like NADH-dependent reductase (Old Yellow Enzyme family)